MAWTNNSPHLEFIWAQCGYMHPLKKIYAPHIVGDFQGHMSIHPIIVAQPKK